jgi:hypothetical protein
VRAAPRSKPVGEADEVRLVDAVEHLDDGPLEDLVLQRGDTERPQPPIPLRDIRPSGRPRPIAPAMDPRVQIVEVCLQIPPVVLPRHAVHPRRGLRTQRPIGRPQAIDIDMVQKRGEPCFLILQRDSAHAVQRTWRASPGSESGARVAGRVPLGHLPFLHNLRRRRTGIVRLLRRYYGGVRLPTAVHLGLTALAFPERPIRPATSGHHAHFAGRANGRPWDLPVLAH